MSIYGLAAKALHATVPLTGGTARGVLVLHLADTLANIDQAIDAVDRLASTYDAAADEMVQLMQARAPVDTGALRSNIGWRREGNEIVVETDAGEHDTFYAGFVEFGTVHMDAEPFFYSSAREVLERYNRQVTAGAALLAAEVGLT